MTIADMIKGNYTSLIVEFTLYLQDIGASYSFIRAAFDNPNADAEQEFQDFLKRIS